jgi:hypothetical protein
MISQRKAINMYFATVLFFVLNLIGLLTPVRASYGGQWARVRHGGLGNDVNFYFRTNLYPADIMIYIAVLVGIVLIGRKLLLSGELKKLFKLYLLTSLLPFIWFAVSLLVGFSTEECNRPSVYFTCHSPVHRISWMLLAYGFLVVLSVVAVKRTIKDLSEPGRKTG